MAITETYLLNVRLCLVCNRVDAWDGTLRDISFAGLRALMKQSCKLIEMNGHFA
jgi:hypothetical protein